MSEPKIAIVVPTCRPERIAAWWEAWRGQLAGCDVYVIEDAPKLTIEAPWPAPEGGRGHSIAWAGIDSDLGADSWIIPRRTDCVRSYGFLLAYRAGADIIMTMDDDCLPGTNATTGTKWNWPLAHSAQLADANELAWSRSCDIVTRGYPKQNMWRPTPVMLNHGLWDGCADLDAVQAFAFTTPAFTRYGQGMITRGMYFPMCGMNLAFRRDIAPAMYFLLMGQKHPPCSCNSGIWVGPRGAYERGCIGHEPESLPFDRFGDIWAGIIAKRICDHLGYAVRSGSPHVLHERASDPFVNLRKEAAGIGENEHFWKRVDAIRLKGETVADCYREVALAVHDWGGEYAAYWRTLGEAMATWVRLLEAK